ncbi:MAG: YmdB family metallophosphoesterase, partial [Oscillospiraceae bacterium]|nr:YmdB family metallophosphoesterase [Oscillospiraceae bacterium]
MKILFIGDVVNEDAGQALAKFLPKFLKQENIDISIANGENSANGNGISPRSAELIFSSGADVITGGNHSLRRDEMAEYYSKAAETNYGSHPKKTLIPANLRSEYSKGYVIIEKHGVKIGIVNLLGTVFMNPCDNPFDAADRIITEMSEKGVKNIFVDFHAE